MCALTVCLSELRLRERMPTVDFLKEIERLASEGRCIKNLHNVISSIYLTYETATHKDGGENREERGRLDRAAIG